MSYLGATKRRMTTRGEQGLRMKPYLLIAMKYRTLDFCKFGVFPQSRIVSQKQSEQIRFVCQSYESYEESAWCSIPSVGPRFRDSLRKFRYLSVHAFGSATERWEYQNGAMSHFSAEKSFLQVSSPVGIDGSRLLDASPNCQERSAYWFDGLDSFSNVNDNNMFDGVRHCKRLDVAH